MCRKLGSIYKNQKVSQSLYTKVSSYAAAHYLFCLQKGFGEPCDNNEECGPGLCCVLYDFWEGSVCSVLGHLHESCSWLTMDELPEVAVPYCRKLSERSSVYTSPYLRYCDCLAGKILPRRIMYPQFRSGLALIKCLYQVWKRWCLESCFWNKYGFF